MNQHGTPEEMIEGAINQFEIEPELLTLQRIEETVGDTQKLRQTKLDAIQSKILSLSKQYNTLSNEVELLNKVSDYNFEILSKIGTENISEADQNIFKLLKKKSTELDNLKVSLAKNLNDLESSINSFNLSKNNILKQIDLSTAKLDQLISSNLTLNSQDSKVLKINLFKNLGISIENFQEDESTSSENDLVIIYNKKTDLTSILKIEAKYSNFFISNYIWDRLE